MVQAFPEWDYHDVNTALSMGPIMGLDEDPTRVITTDVPLHHAMTIIIIF